jgi:hypothetical protein
MNRKQKPYLHPMLIEEMEAILKDLRSHYQKVEDAKDSKDLDPYRDDHQSFYAILSGRLQGMNFGLNILIHRLESTINWHNSQLNDGK